MQGSDDDLGYVPGRSHSSWGPALAVMLILLTLTIWLLGGRPPNAETQGGFVKGYSSAKR